MKSIAFDPHFDEKFAAEYGVRRAGSLDEIYKEADYISLHTNLTPETRDMISATSIAKMKKGVLILNCARGEIVNTHRHGRRAQFRPGWRLRHGRVGP